MSYSEMSYGELLTTAAAAEDAGDLDAMAAIDAELFSRPEMDAAIESVVPVVEDGDDNA